MVNKTGTANPKLPNKLYKYYGNIQYVIDALHNRGIHMDNPVEFNDPFDEMYSPFYIGSDTYKTWIIFQEVINFYFTSSEYIEKYWGQIDFERVKSQIFNGSYKWLISIDDAVAEFIRISGFKKIPKNTVVNALKNNRMGLRKNMNNEQLRVSCFCETNKSLPMWAYYGKNHTGVCVEYNMSLLDKSVKESLLPVIYSENRDKNNVSFHKSDEWKHEMEWRIIKAKQDIKDNYFPFNCVSGIYFGERYDFSNNPNIKTEWLCPNTFSEKEYSMYISLIDEIKKQNNEITLYKATTDLDEYKIIFTPFYTHKGGTSNEV